MDEAGDILLVGKTGGEGVHLIMELGGGLVDGLVDQWGKRLIFLALVLYWNRKIFTGRKEGRLC